MTKDKKPIDRSKKSSIKMKCSRCENVVKVSHDTVSVVCHLCIMKKAS